MGRGEGVRGNGGRWMGEGEGGPIITGKHYVRHISKSDHQFIATGVIAMLNSSFAFGYFLPLSQKALLAV